MIEHKPAWAIPPRADATAKDSEKANFNVTLRIPFEHLPPEDFGLMLSCLGTYQQRQDLRLVARRKKAEHVQRLEEHADRAGQEWKLNKQFACLVKLVGFALKQGDPYRRLGAYYDVLHSLHDRVYRYARKDEHQKERELWDRLERRCLDVLIDLDARLDPVAKTLVPRPVIKAKGPYAKTRARVNGRFVSESAAATPEPPPPEVDPSTLDDDALAALIPEEHR